MRVSLPNKQIFSIRRRWHTKFSLFVLTYIHCPDCHQVNCQDICYCPIISCRCQSLLRKDTVSSKLVFNFFLWKQTVSNDDECESVQPCERFKQTSQSLWSPPYSFCTMAAKKVSHIYLSGKFMFKIHNYDATDFTTPSEQKYIYVYSL